MMAGIDTDGLTPLKNTYLQILIIYWLQ